MELEEIRENAPEGTTHYRILNGEVTYVKKPEFDNVYIWSDYFEKWRPTFWKRIHLSPNIKPI